MGDLVVGFHLSEGGRTGEEYQRSHPREPVFVLIPSGALTFAFTFTDDFFCYLVASTYVRIIRFRNH